MVRPVQTGPKSWRVQIRRKGVQPITKTFSTERLAQRFIDRAESDIEDGKQPTTGTAPTVLKAIEAFRELRENSSRPVTRGTTEFYMLKHLDEGMGSWRVDAVTPQRLAAWARSRMDEGAGPATIGMEVSKLGTVMRHASSWLRVALPEPTGPARPLLDYSGLVGPSQQSDASRAP